MGSNRYGFHVAITQYKCQCILLRAVTGIRKISAVGLPSLGKTMDECALGPMGPGAEAGHVKWLADWLKRVAGDRDAQEETPFASTGALWPALTIHKLL